MKVLVTEKGGKEVSELCTDFPILQRLINLLLLRSSLAQQII